MRAIFLSLVLFISTNISFAQDTLYYFQSESTGLVGVRNQKSETIVKPIFPMPHHYNFQQPIETRTIEFYYLPNWQKIDHNASATPFGAVYNRVGDFLYYPHYTDNGPDYWNNTVRRYVENGKVGLVNQDGIKITSAKWDAMWPEDNCYRVFIGKVKNVRVKGSEYPTLIGTGKTYLINCKGRRISPVKEFRSDINN